MSDITYYFNAWAEGVEEWSTNPGEMVDGVETDYASTTDDGDIQKLTGNTCPGTDLGTISKVELQAYAYADDNDQLGLRPVFGGTADGDTHWEAPGVTPGWKTWWDISADSNSPSLAYISSGAGLSFYGVSWLAQTFTTVGALTIEAISLFLYRVGNPGTITVSIRATDGTGKPTGEDLTSGTTDGNTLTDSSDGEWREVTLTPYLLNAATKYAIVARATGGTAANAGKWKQDSLDPYAGGANHESGDSGSTWTVAGTHDRGFRILFWTWSDVQSLDCDVEQNDVSKGNTMHCGEVQIRVTYEPSGPPPAGQPFRIRMFGIPTAPGIRHGGSPWN